MFVERQAALPESRALFRVDELVVEEHPRKHRAERQHAQRDQHVDRAFVRMIARRAIAVRVLVRRMGVIVMAVAMIVVHRMLDMLALLPPRLAIEGQEDETP